MAKRKIDGSPNPSLTKDTSPRAQDNAGWAYYVACLGDAAELEPLATKLKVKGIDAGDCAVLVERDVAAVVCKAPLSEYGEASLAANIGRLHWVAEKGASHERIVESFAASATVLPLRFGTVFLTEDGIKAFLKKHRQAISKSTSNLRGKQEWGLNVLVDRDVLAESLSLRDASLGELSGKIAAASPGQAYLLKKSLDVAKAQAVRDEIKMVVDRIGRVAGGCADQSIQLGIVKYAQASPVALAGRFAFLIHKEHFDQFREKAGELARDYKDQGFQMELTGPMPPYNFMDELND